MRILLLTLMLAPWGQVAQATIVLTDFRAVLSPSVDPLSGLKSISLLVDSSRFGPGGIAAGLAQVEKGSPDDGIWLVDPGFVGPPDDGMPALTFRLNRAGEVMGVDPEPFRIFLGNPPDDGMPAAGPTLIGWLDFDHVHGSLGSLNLSGVVLHAVDQNGHDIYKDGQPVTHNVDPFTIQAVPEPASIIVWCLMGLSFAGTTWWRRRKRS